MDNPVDQDYDRVVKDLCIFLGGALPSLLASVYYLRKITSENRRFNNINSPGDILQPCEIPFLAVNRDQHSNYLKANLSLAPTDFPGRVRSAGTG